jgi:hypothetical protein
MKQKLLAKFVIKKIKKHTATKIQKNYSPSKKQSLWQE